MAFDSNFIEEMKLQLNIVDVIGREVNLKKSGANYKGLCPFHSEKTPSFMVNEEKQIFNCFGCGEKGDVIKFVESFYKIPFMEAVDKLCDEYGIKKPENTHRGPRIDYDKYYEINAKAARYYYNCLGVKGNPGLAYFRSRKLSKDTITQFGLGYAPDGWTSLVDYLRSEGVSDDDMLKLGLAKQGKNGLYDKFRNRVVFPIINSQAKVIGFGARVLDDSKPKYLNSDESDIFLKKNNLFGLNLTRKEISDANQAVMVEGYMDVISLYQNGVKNVTASLGTALTENQARLITKYSKNIVLSYDSDAAGITAALKGIDVMSRTGANIRVLNVPDGKDPDDYVKKHGRDAFYKLVDEALPATDYRLRIAAEGYDFKNDRDVLDYFNKIVPILRSLGPVEQDIYIKKLSDSYGVSEHAIMMSVQTDTDKERKPAIGRQSYSSRRKENTDRDTRIEMSFLVLALFNSRYLKRIREDGIEFRSGLTQKILSAEEAFADESDNGTHRMDEKKVFEKLDPDEEKVFSGYIKSTELGYDDEAFYNETIKSYRINGYKDERVEILNGIAVAEKTDRPDEMKKLAARLIEINDLIKKYTEG